MKALTAAEKVKVIRDRMYKEQEGVCAICGLHMTPSQAVLDHSHSTGRVRAVLHRCCNSGEGKMVSLLRRFFNHVDIEEISEIDTLMNDLHYHWFQKDYSNMPYHPSHKFPEHRAIARLRKEVKGAKLQKTKDRKKAQIKELQELIKAKYDI